MKGVAPKVRETRSGLTETVIPQTGFFVIWVPVERNRCPATSF